MCSNVGVVVYHSSIQENAHQKLLVEKLMKDYSASFVLIIIVLLISFRCFTSMFQEDMQNTAHNQRNDVQSLKILQQDYCGMCMYSAELKLNVVLMSIIQCCYPQL